MKELDKKMQVLISGEHHALLLRIGSTTRRKPSAMVEWLIEEEYRRMLAEQRRREAETLRMRELETKCREPERSVPHDLTPSS